MAEIVPKHEDEDDEDEVHEKMTMTKMSTMLAIMSLRMTTLLTLKTTTWMTIQVGSSFVLVRKPSDAFTLSPPVRRSEAATISVARSREASVPVVS